MANLLELNRINIQIPDAGVVRVVAGATVTIYETMPDGTAAVTKDGTVSLGAVKSVLYDDRTASITKSNPLTADSQGLVEFYVDSPEVHILVSTPTGIIYGIPWFSTTSSDFVELESFGAVGDGVADDTLAIMAAHDALPSTGGRITLKQGKLYRHASQLLFTKRIEIDGTISLEDQTVTPNCGFIKASTLHATGIILSGPCSKMVGVAYKGEVGNTGDGIQIRTRSVVLRDVSVTKMGDVGIRIGDASVSYNCNLFQLHNVVSRGNGGDGIYMHSDDSNSDPKANAGTFIGVECNFNGGHGLHMGNSNTNTFIGYHGESNTGWGIYLEKRAQLNVFIGGDLEINTAGGINVADALAVDNIFIFPNYQTFSDTPNARTIRYDKTVANMPHGLGEIFTNGGITGHNPNLSGSNQQYMSFWDAAAERIRLGWTAIAPVTGLVPAQILVDGSTLYIASRDTASGKVKIMAQTGLAFYILLDPQNSKVEITNSLVLTGGGGGHIQLPEVTEPGNGPANTGRLFVKDNGAGKSQLCVRFASGATQVVATEP